VLHRKCFRYNSYPSYIYTYDRHSILPTNDDIHIDSGVDIILNNTVLYNAMIYPFTRMAIKGALWYQGKLL